MKNAPQVITVPLGTPLREAQEMFQAQVRHAARGRRVEFKNRKGYVLPPNGGRPSKFRMELEQPPVPKPSVLPA